MRKPKKNNPEQQKPMESALEAPVAPASAAPSGADSEPIARRAAVPALLFGVLAALLFWGDLHILGHGGGLDAQVHYPFLSTNDLAGYSIREPKDPRLVNGEKLYNLLCASCHQADGLGGVSQGCPPLAGSDWVLADGPGQLAAIVLKGLSGPIEVSGKQYGTGVMVGFGNEGGMSDDDVASVLSFIRNHWSNKAPLVEAADVKKVRALVKDHSGPMTVPDLEKIPLKP